MLNVYYVSILNFAGLYVSAYLISPLAFAGKQPNSMINTFFDFLYFSSAVGSSIGFGDISPLTLPIRYVILIEILFTQLVQKIVFRGFSFFFKLKKIEEQHKKYRDDIRSLK